MTEILPHLTKKTDSINKRNNSLNMTVTTNDRGQQNLFAREPRMYVDHTYVQRYGYETHAERAEKLNGRTAMVGFVFALISYSITGNLFFGLA